MNFLAHLFLSGENDEVMVGNLLEDYIVGKIDHERNKSYNQNIKNGILLHRIIDSFTDTNNNVSNCKTVLYEKYHKYAAVLVDIYFDHYLSIHWNKFSNENFKDFRKRVYQNFFTHWKVLPEKMKPMVGSMIEHDWLKNYGEFWGIERALVGISKRTTYVSKMELATEDLKIHYQLFEENFLVFFPALQQECKNFLIQNNYTYQHFK